MNKEKEGADLPMLKVVAKNQSVVFHSFFLNRILDINRAALSRLVWLPVVLFLFFVGAFQLMCYKLSLEILAPPVLSLTLLLSALVTLMLLQVVATTLHLLDAAADRALITTAEKLKIPRIAWKKQEILLFLVMVGSASLFFEFFP